jgi:hypothetical protein
MRTSTRLSGSTSSSVKERGSHGALRSAATSSLRPASGQDLSLSNGVNSQLSSPPCSVKERGSHGALRSSVAASTTAHSLITDHSSLFSPSPSASGQDLSLSNGVNSQLSSPPRSRRNAAGGEAGLSKPSESSTPSPSVKERGSHGALRSSLPNAVNRLSSDSISSVKERGSHGALRSSTIHHSLITDHHSLPPSPSLTLASVISPIPSFEFVSDFVLRDSDFHHPRL